MPSRIFHCITIYLPGLKTFHLVRKCNLCVEATEPLARPTPGPLFRVLQTIRRGNASTTVIELEVETMADHSTTPGGQSVYPLPPADYSDAGYRYEDASQSIPAAIPPPPANQPQQQQQLPVYAEQPNESLPGPESAAAAGPPSATKSKGSGEVKPRLRKACDSCSVRKVKVRFVESIRAAGH